MNINLERWKMNVLLYMGTLAFLVYSYIKDKGKTRK